MKRKFGELLSKEKEILKIAANLKDYGLIEFTGYDLGKITNDMKRITTGQIYRSLGYLFKAGYLERRWDNPGGSSVRRRLYKLKDKS